jgi:hypothetical protein
VGEVLEEDDSVITFLLFEGLKVDSRGGEEGFGLGDCVGFREGLLYGGVGVGGVEDVGFCDS